MRIHVFLVLLIAISQPVIAKLYKWVDEDGNVQYSDKLPPAAVRKPHENLDSSGLVINKTGRAKTPEEIAEEERVRKLRKETQRQIDEQKARDRVLLNTYRSEDDIILARDGKLATINSQIRITYTNITRLKERLKCIFDLVIDFGTSQSPKSTRPLTTYLCPSRPGHQALRNNFASSLLLRTCLPMTGRRVWMPTLLPLWRYAHDG